jgi:hypothetical protein
MTFFQATINNAFLIRFLRLFSKTGVQFYYLDSVGSSNIKKGTANGFETAPGKTISSYYPFNAVLGADLKR